MIGFWSLLLVTDQVPADQKPYAISFHLAGEFLTAILLVTSGVGLWINKIWSKILSPVSLGLLLYTVIVSPGYYAQLGETPMVTLFLTLTILTSIAIAVQIKKEIGS